MERRSAERGHYPLLVWRKAMDLAESTYAVTLRLPQHETYGLASQLRRAAASIPSNIAEGYGRSSRKDYLRHLGIANGSLLELETQIILAERVAYLTEQKAKVILGLSSEVGKMLARMVAGLRRLPTPER
ncbi:MAG TPA: four helix bundle protein [Gemmatimonadales bacterium]|nr:four helix bundle protein [Gemmatimonadales bacterium]